MLSITFQSRWEAERVSRIVRNIGLTEPPLLKWGVDLADRMDAQIIRKRGKRGEELRRE